MSWILLDAPVPSLNTSENLRYVASDAYLYECQYYQCIHAFFACSVACTEQFHGLSPGQPLQPQPVALVIYH